MELATARRTRTILIGVGLLAMAMLLLLWQQVDATGCETADLDLATCDEIVPVEAEQANADRLG